MNMLMLAEVTQLAKNTDINGLWCLASILFIVIVFIAYTLGPIHGSWICFIFWIIAVCVTGDTTGDSIPLWFYHPASPCFIFAISGSPFILVCMFSANKLL